MDPQGFVFRKSLDLERGFFLMFLTVSGYPGEQSGSPFNIPS